MEGYPRPVFEVSGIRHGEHHPGLHPVNPRNLSSRPNCSNLSRYRHIPGSALSATTAGRLGKRKVELEQGFGIEVFSPYGGILIVREQGIKTSVIDYFLSVFLRAFVVVVHI